MPLPGVVRVNENIHVRRVAMCPRISSALVSLYFVIIMLTAEPVQHALPGFQTGENVKRAVVARRPVRRDARAPAAATTLSVGADRTRLGTGTETAALAAGRKCPEEGSPRPGL